MSSFTNNLSNEKMVRLFNEFCFYEFDYSSDYFQVPSSSQASSSAPPAAPSPPVSPLRSCLKRRRGASPELERPQPKRVWGFSVVGEVGGPSSSSGPAAVGGSYRDPSPAGSSSSYS